MSCNKGRLKPVLSHQIGFASAAEGEESTWQGQLMQTKRAISELKSETKQASMRLAHCKEELKSKTSEVRKTENAYKYAWLEFPAFGKFP